MKIVEARLLTGGHSIKFNWYRQEIVTQGALPIGPHSRSPLALRGVRRAFLSAVGAYPWALPFTDCVARGMPVCDRLIPHPFPDNLSSYPPRGVLTDKTNSR